MRKLIAKIIVAINRLLDSFSVRFNSQYKLSRGAELNALVGFFRMFTPYENGYSLIRIGRNGDGGYLVPDDLIGISACYSPGVGDSWEFERQIAESHGIPSHMLDDTVKPPIGLTSMQTFVSLKLGAFTNSKQLSLEDWVEQNDPIGSADDLLLQMDIESHEWLSLLVTPNKVLKRFRILIVEFHSLPLTSNPWILSRVYDPLISRLLEEFDIVHCHPNNAVGTFRYLGIDFPDTLEVTFHRKDRALNVLTPRTLPHPLDTESLPFSPPVKIDHIFNLDNPQASTTSD